MIQSQLTLPKIPMLLIRVLQLHSPSIHPPNSVFPSFIPQSPDLDGIPWSSWENLGAAGTPSTTSGLGPSPHPQFLEYLRACRTDRNASPAEWVTCTLVICWPLALFVFF